MLQHHRVERRWHTYSVVAVVLLPLLPNEHSPAAVARPHTTAGASRAKGAVCDRRWVVMHCRPGIRWCQRVAAFLYQCSPVPFPDHTCAHLTGDFASFPSKTPKHFHRNGD